VNAKTALTALVLLFLLAPSAAQAGDVDTQFLFGFTQGSDVGELGEKEIESETVGRFGKVDGFERNSFLLRIFVSRSAPSSTTPRSLA
jgi:hypothetical protein